MLSLITEQGWSAGIVPFALFEATTGQIVGVSALAIALTAYIAYCWIEQKTTARIPWVLPWVYRRDQPTLYWFEMGFYIFIDALSIAMLILFLW